MAKDAKGHGSDGRGGYASMAAASKLNYSLPDKSGKYAGGDARQAHYDAKEGNLDAFAEGAIRAFGNRAAADALASGPKSDPVPVHNSMTSNSTHNDQGHAWGSPEALKDFSSRYNPKGFASGKQEINRAKLSERRRAFLNG